MDNTQNLPGEEIALSEMERDAIGEILNISMGSAATALSTMLEKQVTITTPKLERNQFKDIDCSDLEPAILVKIMYVEGVSGANVMMFRQHDMQVIINLLMGNDDESTSDDFEFDDMSMSAACEIMNQMMGASATAMSEIVNTPVNISTPEAFLVETSAETQEVFNGIRGDDEVVSVSFKMMIKDVLNTVFRCFLPIGLAKGLVDAVNKQEEEPLQEEAPELPPQPQQVPLQPQQVPPQPQQVPPQPQQVPPQPQQVPPQPQQVPQPQPPQPQQVPPQPQQVPPQPQQVPQQQVFPASVPVSQLQQPASTPYMPQFSAPNFAAPLQQTDYSQAPGVPYAAYPPMPQQYQSRIPPVDVRQAGFPDFAQQAHMAQAPYPSNMGLLMGVQLDVSVIVGRTRRKIKDVIDFGQGTVVLLDTQTGAPAEVVVNGQLIARGDIVVVGDNFGVRITEIVGTKELMDSLNSCSN